MGDDDGLVVKRVVRFADAAIGGLQKPYRPQPGISFRALRAAVRG